MRVFGYEITAKKKLNEEDEEKQKVEGDKLMTRSCHSNLEYLLEVDPVEMGELAPTNRGHVDFEEVVTKID